ncbi:MAG: DUF1919 domain-containing protein, partial [Bacteroidales bacterium]|nr:DUF1919 domain-containing protein [Bacteroidales bacterium]
FILLPLRRDLWLSLSHGLSRMSRIMDLKALEGKIRVNVREKLNPYLSKFRKKKLRRPEFTIISNNCWAGHVYRYYGIPYLTPTVGLFFMADDYIRFVSNLKHYINQSDNLTFKPTSKKLEEKADRLRKELNLSCPIGFIDDVMIVFLHYKTEDEAYHKWTRRAKRVVWDNILIKFSEQNECLPEHLKAFDALEHESKFCFVSDKMGLDSEIWFKECSGKGQIPNDTTNFRKYINLTKWLNGDDDFRR